MSIFRIIPLFALVGCAPGQSPTNNVVIDNVGRFQFHPASKDLPAFVLDTTSGCLSHVAQTEKTTSKSEWIELDTEFATWRCPLTPTKKLKKPG